MTNEETMQNSYSESLFSLFLKFIGSFIICYFIAVLLYWGGIICAFRMGGEGLNVDTFVFLFSPIAALLISAIINFIINKKVVFRSAGHGLPQFIMFFILTTLLLLGFHFGLAAYWKGEYIPTTPHPVAGALYCLISFFPQKFFIFRQSKK